MEEDSMNRNTKKTNIGFLKLQAFSVGLLLGCMSIAGAATAAALPKGDCADPKPNTDLRHCRLEGVDLKDKDLSGSDLRVMSLYKTQMQGANLTNALFDRNKLLLAKLDGAQGLPKEILDTLSIYNVINDKNFLVSYNNNSNSTITLSPHEAAQGIQNNIAGLASINMLSNVDNMSHTIAVLDWPRYSETKGMVIVARFDNGKFDMPACYQSANLLNGDKYYYPDWNSMKVKPLAKGGYLIGIQASGSDGDGEGIGGWDMVVFLKLSPICGLTVLQKVDSGWAEGVDKTGCRGEHLDYRFLDEQTAEIMNTAHTCDSSAKSKAKVNRKKIILN
jgi:hypothetical protein